jgi:hypothetical protein
LCRVFDALETKRVVFEKAMWAHRKS